MVASQGPCLGRPIADHTRPIPIPYGQKHQNLSNFSRSQQHSLRASRQEVLRLYKRVPCPLTPCSRGATNKRNRARKAVLSARRVKDRQHRMGCPSGCRGCAARSPDISGSSSGTPRRLSWARLSRVEAKAHKYMMCFNSPQIESCPTCKLTPVSNKANATICDFPFSRCGWKSLRIGNC